MSSLSAKAVDCIGDAELEAAVGDQIRAGRFAIDTSTLREAPMCSGITLAQAIQLLVKRIPQGEMATSVKEHQASPAAAASSSPSGQIRSRYQALLGYVGKYHWDKVQGFTLFKHPLVVEGMNRANVPPAIRKELLKYDVTTAIDRQGEVVRDLGCIPHQCDGFYYRFFISAQTGAAALCHFQGTATWYVTGLQSPLVARGTQCVDDLVQAPAEVAQALRSGTAAGGTASSSSAAQVRLPDVSRSLVFEQPARCSSDGLDRLFRAAVDRQSVDVLPVGSLSFTRRGPDKDGWFTSRASTRASWNGLTIIAFEFLYLPDSDGTQKNIHFAEPAKTVQARLISMGIPVRRISDTYEASGGMPVFISIEPYGSGSALQCGT